jgi:protein tyrosine phosphatase (PTP) superfamily phosphohydrolase (DUF442 family)
MVVPTMTMSDLGPIQVGSVRNFGWVLPALLARGEQPELQPATFQALADAGVTAIVSLRPDGEAPSPRAQRTWPVYEVAQERELALGAGLAFANVPLEDFSGQPPEGVAAALREIDLLVGEGQRVYVHCRAGAGRAGLISGAYAVTRGMSGDQAADGYVRFMEHVGSTFSISEEQWAAFARRVGQPQVWWTLRHVVAALGSPITREQPHLLPPEAPAGSEGWDARYGKVLRPWRRTCSQRAPL